MEVVACTSSRVHSELAVLRRLGASRHATKGLRRGRAALEGLIKGIASLDCVRLLLEIRAVFHLNRSSLATRYERYGYWQAYGLLLSELLSRTSTDTIQESVWAELRDWLREASSWSEREEAVRTLAHMLPTVRVDASQLTRFWNVFGAYTEYHRAAYLNPAERTDSFLKAARTCNELFYQVVFSGPDTPSEGNIRELARAGGLALHLAVIAEDDLPKWSTAVAKLCEIIDKRGHRSEPVQEQLWGISRALDGYSRGEVRAARRIQYKQVLETLLPRLRNGRQGGQRKQMLPEDRTCRVSIAGQASIDIEGTVRDVCCTTCSGFAAELRGLSLESAPVIEEGQRRPGGVGPFNRLRLWYRNGYDPGAPLSTAERIELTVRYSRGGSRALTLPCSIVRAWKLISGDGIGVALLAPLEQSELPDEWKAYVNESTYLGRYDSLT